MTNACVIVSDSSVISLEELLKSYKEKNVYIIKKDTISESTILSCNKLSINEESFEIEFYNRTHFILSKNDSVLMFDGKSRKVDKLHIGERLMPFSITRKDTQQLINETEGYYVIKNIKRVKTETSYQINAKNGGMIAVVPIMENGKFNEIGGCFVSCFVN